MDVNHEQINQFFKCTEVNFKQNKFPVVFYNESGECLNQNKKSTIQRKLISIDSSFTTQKYNTARPKLGSWPVTKNDQTEHVKHQQIEGKTRIASNFLNNSQISNEIYQENKNVKKELEKINARVRYLQNQVNNTNLTKKQSGYQIYHIFAIFIIGIYVGNLFLTNC